MRKSAGEAKENEANPERSQSQALSLQVVTAPGMGPLMLRDRGSAGFRA